MEAGTSPPHCGTMDVNLEFRGVDCSVGKTDTAVRTILCETGWENAESLEDAFASQALKNTKPFLVVEVGKERRKVFSW